MSVRSDSPIPYSEEWWRVTLTSIGDGVIVTNATGRVTFMNPVAESLTGWTMEEAIGQPSETVFSVVDETSGESVASPVRRALQTGAVTEFANHTVRQEGGGDGVLINDCAAPVRDASGKLIGAVLVFRDLSERQRAEVAQSHLSAIITSSDDAIISKTLDGRITSWNGAAERIFGYHADEIIGKHISILIPPGRLMEEDEILERLKRGERIEHYETIRLRKDGAPLEISLTISPLKDSHGRIIGASKIARDITEQKRLESVRAYLAAIVESSDDAIIGKTLDSIITSWNEAAERIFGYTAAEAVGLPIFILIPTERHEEESGILERLRRGERIDHFETVRQKKDGTKIDVSLTISPIKNRDGEIIGASKIARDITEKRRLLEREHQALEKAETANRLKDEFLSTLSHELRTPLNAMLGWSTLLRRGVGPEQFKQGLETIERNVRVQAQIVEDLLDLSRMMTGKVRLDVQRVSLPEVIEAASEAMGPAAEAKGVRLQIVLDTFAGFVSGDPNRLQQVFYNLLSNAIKFTPKGGRVQVMLERVNSHLEVSVIDNGIGIKPEFLPYVFDRFRQEDSTAKREYGGLGIGLSIVRQLVEMHGGSVRVKSPGEGLGATFIVGLPMMAIRGGDEGSRVYPKAQGEIVEEIPDALDGVTVLVVDDEPDSRELIRVVLEGDKAKVITAASAKEGMRILTAQKVDVLISDIGLPQEDGFEFISQVRALDDSGVGKIPAIALTAFARSEDRTRALLAGFQIHVAKPVEPAELVATVVSLARER
jgi:PAS domain S-box-containing protein